ncbi:DUF1707 and DUF4870 domain-containing protein [Actinomadura rudentiformis]|uniref:DUF1707 and DUF4870 domain-containing protein n=1 Tax=Actinomadura rudentiformis TaxID=359158 RepID=A0A6H9Z061_9ACTN|nr:DUF1707 and DUF4870 domain-containing protein [Actinomadura rudentiformis]KAB2346366.1 DUF1707 and DUF4870 domain-containing protein [Actinomadura rudentiformis]
MDSSHATDLRVSDIEREPVIERLQEAYAEGRLEHAEFDMRMHLAMTARTRGELAGVLYDLAPAPVPPGSPKRGPALPGDGTWDGPPPTGEDRMLAAVAHAIGYPTLFVGPLIMMLLSGKRSAYVRRHAVEALNFQLTVLLITIVTFGVGGMLYAITWIVAGIAAVIALTGKSFRYPWILRLVK